MSQRPPPAAHGGGEPGGDDLDREAVAGAVRDVLLERGYDGLTIAEVAGRANADPSVIYELWPSKVDLVMWLILGEYRRHIGHIDTGNVRDDLLTFLARFMATVSGAHASVIAAVLARVRSYPEMEMARMTEPIRDFLQGAMTGILDRAAERGEIEPGGPFHMVGEVVRAVGLYRLQVTLDPLDEELARDLVDRILLPALRWRGPVPEGPARGLRPRAGGAGGTREGTRR